MEDKTMYKEIKERLKNYAKEIKDVKRLRKPSNWTKEDQKIRGPMFDVQSSLNQLKYHFRHIHIAYCEVRGRTRDQIEKPSEFNKPNQKYIDKIKEEILQKIKDEQTLRASQNGS